MRVSEVILSGRPVKIDLITSPFHSTDPATWTLPAWDFYAGTHAFPSIQWNDDGGIIGTIDFQIRVDPARVASVIAFGVTAPEGTLLMGTFNVPAGFRDTVANGRISFVIQPYQAA